MALESIRIVKAENIPAETRSTHDLPDKGFVEVRIERSSDPKPSFHKLNKNRMQSFRDKLKKKNLLFK